MKKTLFLCLVCILLLSVFLTSCGTNAVENNKPSSDSTTIVGDDTSTPDSPTLDLNAGMTPKPTDGLLFTETYNYSTNTAGYVVSGAIRADDITDLVVPPTYNGKPVIGIMAKDDHYSLFPKVKTVTLPENLQFIEEFAFYDCYNLTSVTLPSTLKYIGRMAFYECSKLIALSFRGTEAQWNAIEKVYEWNLHCIASVLFEQ